MALTAGDVLVYDGSSWINTGQTKVLLGSDPAANDDYGLLNLGGGGFGGGAVPNFQGNAQGTGLAVNTGSSFTGNLSDLQVAGVSRSRVNSVGTLTQNAVDTNTGGVTYGLILKHEPTGTAGTGVGTGVQFVLEKSTGSSQEAGYIQCYYTNASSPSSAMVFAVYAAGTATDVLFLESTGVAGLGQARINGDFSHTSSSRKIGFFGATPVVRTAAYTQTYATAARTNPTATGLASGQGGTPYASLADLQSVQQLVNAILDDLQAYGLLQ